MAFLNPAKLGKKIDAARLGERQIYAETGEANRKKERVYAGDKLE